MTADELIPGVLYWTAVDGHIVSATFQTSVVGIDNLKTPHFIFCTYTYKLKIFYLNLLEIREVFLTQEEAHKSLGDWFLMKSKEYANYNPQPK